MTHLHFTLNQEEIQELLLENRSETFKKLLESALNSVLQAESEEQLSAGRYQRSDERTDYRNGSRDRELNTRIEYAFSLFLKPFLYCSFCVNCMVAVCPFTFCMNAI